MSRERFYRLTWIAPVLIFSLIFSGCVSKTAQSAIPTNLHTDRHSTH